MDIKEAVAAIEALDHTDPEMAHGEADEILLEMVDPDIKAAYEALVQRCLWWATA